MQIPPTIALLNLANTLPMQGAAAAPPVAKGTPSFTPPPPPATQGAADDRPPQGRALRGSIINILA
jgi:hypothetical protein